MLVLISLYVLSIVSAAINKQLMAVITQGYLSKMRESMFNGMQDLPIRYFDTHNHGDIMSYYTNDIDSLRQVVSESLPQLLTSAIMVLTLFGIMLWYSLWLTGIVLAGVAVILIVTKMIGGGAARYFFAQQKAVAQTEGFIEEYMNGQRVVKVFCHEKEAKRDFDKVNDFLFGQSNQAHRYANMLMPVLGNIGHVVYVIIAILGGVFILNGVSNVSIGMLFDEKLAMFGVALVVSFLQMSRQFSNNVNQVSQQVNSVVMGLAGASRVFTLIDEPSETDEGYVDLVNVKEVEGELVECAEHTGLWAWRHPHKADGSVTYTKLEGDVTMTEVDRKSVV